MLFYVMVLDGGEITISRSGSLILFEGKDCLSEALMLPLGVIGHFVLYSLVFTNFSSDVCCGKRFGENSFL